MAKLTKKSNQDPKRLQSLENRWERLVEANWHKRYINDPDKSERYEKCLLYIREQKAKRQAENRRANENNPALQFLRSTAGLNGSQVLMLNYKKQ